MDNDVPAELRKLIKKIHRETGLTQEGMADKIGFSRVHFSRLKKSDPHQLLDLLKEDFLESSEKELATNQPKQPTKKNTPINQLNEDAAPYSNRVDDLLKIITNLSETVKSQQEVIERMFDKKAVASA